MNELITIQNTNGKQTVNARDLHEFLESKQDFSTWVKSRIGQYGFIENDDFVKLHKKMELSQTGQNAIEYHISIDMAKELSMVERNEKGKQARQYFIECERRAKDPMTALNDPAAMRGLLLTYTEKVLALEEVVAEQKVDALDRISSADGLTNITNTAKTLQMHPKDLFSLMSNNRWIYKRAGGRNWIGYQDKIQQGLLSHKTTTVSKSDGSEKTVEQVLVTPKGLVRLASITGVEVAA